MTDLPAMERCPYTKLGRHELSAVIPDDDDRDLTLFCSHCGALRRVPVMGRLDDLSADEIAAAARRLPGVAESGYGRRLTSD